MQLVNWDPNSCRDSHRAKTRGSICQPVWAPLCRMAAWWHGGSMGFGSETLILPGAGSVTPWASQCVWSSVSLFWNQAETSSRGCGQNQVNEVCPHAGGHNILCSCGLLAVSSEGGSFGLEPCSLSISAGLHGAQVSSWTPTTTRLILTQPAALKSLGSLAMGSVPCRVPGPSSSATS